MRIPLQASRLARRDAVSAGNYAWIADTVSEGQPVVVVAVLARVLALCLDVNIESYQSLAAVGFLLVTMVLCIKYLRHRRRASENPPPYIQPEYLRKRWREWRPWRTYSSVKSTTPEPRSSSGTGRPSTSELAMSSVRHSNRPRSTVTTTSSNGQGAASLANNEDSVDRRQSVRSIISLPPYQSAPRPDERLVAREGERAGVDTIVDLPETEQENESRREEEMEALYAIRQARRREQTEREQRRQERRQARERGDWARLEQLEQESRQRARARAASAASNVLLTVASGGRATSNSASAASSMTDLSHAQQRGEQRSNQDSALLIAELNALRESNSNSRRVSSVSYADLGFARHDGSRLRAESVESDHRPLLDGAAAFGSSANSGRRSRATSSATSTREGSRSRASIAPVGRNRAASTDVPPPNDHSNSSSSGNTATQLTPPSDASGMDFDEQDLPPEPPSYEDDHEVHYGGEAPPYTSPTTERGPQISVTLPAPPPVHVPGGPGNRISLGVTGNGSSLRQEIKPDDLDDEVTDREGERGRQETRDAEIQRNAPQLRLRTDSDPEEQIAAAPVIHIMSATPITARPEGARGSGFGIHDNEGRDD